MRWPGANLEEKHEPRGMSVAEAQNADSMKSSGRNLTLAAIEKAVTLQRSRPERDMAPERRKMPPSGDTCDKAELRRRGQPPLPPRAAREAAGSGHPATGGAAPQTGPPASHRIAN